MLTWEKDHHINNKGNEIFCLDEQDILVVISRGPLTTKGGGTVKGVYFFGNASSWPEIASVYTSEGYESNSGSHKLSHNRCIWL